MALADTNKVGLYINKETAWGETPSTPGMEQLRYTGESLAYNKQSVMSEVIRDDRMRDQVALVGFTTEGDINIELAARSFDQLIEGALSGNWSKTDEFSGITFAVDGTNNQITDSGNGLDGIAVGSWVYPSGFTNKANNRPRKVTAVAAGAITVEDTDNTLVTEAAGNTITLSTTGIRGDAGDIDAVAPDQLTSTTLDFTTLGLSVGQKVRVTGFSNSANNGIFEIAVISANTLEFVEQTIENETAGSAARISIYGRMLRNGTVQHSYHIEKKFSDVTQFLSFRGMRVGTMSLNLAAQEIITGAFSFMGKEAVLGQSTVSGSTYESDPTEVLTASANVGTLKKDGATFSGAIRSIALELENNLRIQNVVGQLAAFGIGYGFTDISGTIEAYFEDETLYEHLLNHDTVEFEFRMTDNDGNLYVINIPKFYFTTGAPTAPGGNDDVMVPLEFQAVRDETLDCMIQIDSLQAVA